MAVPEATCVGLSGVAILGVGVAVAVADGVSVASGCVHAPISTTPKATVKNRTARNLLRNGHGCDLGENRIFDCQDVLADPAVLGDFSVDFASAVNHRGVVAPTQ